MIVHVLAIALVAGLYWFFISRIARVTAAVRNVAAGMAPRLSKTGVPALDALSEALRQMHRDAAIQIEALEDEKQDATAIIDAMVEGVLSADARGRITIANPAARRMLGYPDGTGLPSLSVLFRSKSARAAIDEVLMGEVVRDRELEMDDQTLILNARPLADRGVMLVLHDLTAMRRLEMVRRDFVANASHELKTPLTSILGYVETLAAEDDSMDEATRRGFIRTIQTNAHRMLHLIDDLLDLSRIESGRWNPASTRIEIAPLVEESWQLLHNKADARRVTMAALIAPDATTLTADPETIPQILGNLFDNAIRYVPAGGIVTVRSELKDGGILLSVEDNGSGIAPEHLHRIFERFYRVDASRSRDEGGTGLGLAIVRHMIESQGGRVWAESTLREGTAIRCWFPGV